MMQMRSTKFCKFNIRSLKCEHTCLLNKKYTNCEFYKYFSYSVVGTDGGTFWSAITPEEKIRVTRNTQATTTAATIVSLNNN